MPPGKGHRVFSEETSYKMRALLRLVVTKGTGKKADAPGYRVGGKTGTAQKIVGGHYSNSLNVTSFAGVFPMDEPRYVIVVMLDEPKATAETFGFTHRRLERRAGRVARPSAGSRRCSASGPTSAASRTWPRCCPTFTKKRNINPMLLGDLAGIASDSEVTGFALDHRKVAPGNVFGAFRGTRFNGEDFIAEAVQARRGRGGRPARGEGRGRAAPRRR